MPIKYNLTKYDMLAESFHELSQKREAPFSNDEETLKAAAIIVASFCSPHSWQTNKAIAAGDPQLLYSPEIKNEYLMAVKENWKKVRNMDVQEVSCANIRDNLFYIWLSINVEKPKRNVFVAGWEKLKQEFDEECDGINIQRNI